MKISAPSALVAVTSHCSWNRSTENGRPVAYEDFATGWNTRFRVTGRPVYPAVAPDGSLFLSDDEGGRIYRIQWIG